MTAYPELPKKKKALEERFAVAVLELAMKEEGRLFHLLVKRPPGGLLGGLLEFPSVEVPEDGSTRGGAKAVGDGRGAGSRAKEAAAIDTLLGDILGPKVWGKGRAALQVHSREHMGEVRHVFTHRVHTYSVERFCVTRRESLEGLPERGFRGQSLKWVEDLLMESEGLTTGVKKVFDLTQRWGGKKRGGKGGHRKRGVASSPPGLKEEGLGTKVQSKKMGVAMPEMKSEPKRQRTANAGPSSGLRRRAAA